MYKPFFYLKSEMDRLTLFNEVNIYMGFKIKIISMVFDRNYAGDFMRTTENVPYTLLYTRTFVRGTPLPPETRCRTPRNCTMKSLWEVCLGDGGCFSSGCFVSGLKKKKIYTNETVYFQGSGGGR